MKKPHVRSIFLILAIGLLYAAAASAQNSIKLLEGKVLDGKSQEPVKGGLVTMMMNTRHDSTLTRRARVNSETGRYQIIVEPSDVYSFIAEAPGYYAAEIVATPKEEGYEEIESNMSLKAAPVGDTTFMGGVSINDRNEIVGTKDFEAVAVKIQKNRGVAYKISMEMPVDIPSALDQTGPSYEQRYLQAMKYYMMLHKISSMRLTWEVISTDLSADKLRKPSKEKKVTVSIITNGPAELPKEN